MLSELLTLLGMLLAVAAILVLAYVSTRFIATRSMLGTGAPGGARQIRILDQLLVSREVKLLMAQVGERYFLLSASPSGVDMLAEFTAEEAAAWLRAPENGDTAGRMSFQEALMAQLKNRKKK